MKRLFFVKFSCLLMIMSFVLSCTPKQDEESSKNQRSQMETVDSISDAQQQTENQTSELKTAASTNDALQSSVNQGEQAEESTPLTDAQREELLASLKNIKMIPVEGGSFERPLKDGGTKTISVDSFQMSQYEVTVEQFRAFLKETKAEHVLNDRDDVGVVFQFSLAPVFIIPPDWPAVFVDFFNACAFCNWLSEKEGLEPCYTLGTNDPKKPNDTKVMWDTSKNGYHLPTEAEWEYVASQTDISDLKSVAVLCYDHMKSDKPETIGSKAPNALGFYDIIGNVSEWCWDPYHADYYENCEPDNPTGPDAGYNPTPVDPYNQGFPPSTTDRVVKGSDSRRSWSLDELHVFERDYAEPAGQINPVRAICIGIRLVRNKEK